MNLQKAINVLQQELKKDKKYRKRWEDNITMCYIDASKKMKKQNIHSVEKIAAEGANMFLKILIQ